MTNANPCRPAGDTATIAVLSWAWAAVAVEPRTPPSRWLAVHPADASLAARLAGHLGQQSPVPARCAF